MYTAIIIFVCIFLVFDFIIGWPFKHKTERNEHFMILKFTIIETEEVFFTALSKKDADYILKKGPYKQDLRTITVEPATNKSELCNVVLTVESNDLIKNILKALHKKK